MYNATEGLQDTGEGVGSYSERYAIFRGVVANMLRMCYVREGELTGPKKRAKMRCVILMDSPLETIFLTDIL